MRVLRFGLKPLIFLAALVPAALLVRGAIQNDLGANPIEEITHQTGLWTLRFLMITLAVTPVRRITGWHAVIRLRRMLGLFGFFYACLHFLTYLVLDQFFAFDAIIADIAKRPFITMGFAGFVLLIPLAATSTAGMMRRLGRRWQRLHRVIYVAAFCGVLHYLWLVKADLRDPRVYSITLALLLGVRVVGELARHLSAPASRSRLVAKSPRPANAGHYD
ncbi:MAG: sulfoxide reductase heme-binding subunit YedZ [Acidobacteria bacterium]|nr:sulfoxide reductase heme-binding subunit YedZ [Acidobacteriota bacterium]